jgi:hypothetical protein
MTVIIPWVPFGITGIVSWSIWALRQFRSRWGCREIVNDYRITSSLVGCSPPPFVPDQERHPGGRHQRAPGRAS